MSGTSITISRAKPPAGQDYEALLDQAISITQTLSGEIWTNYNESDPGVTILQQLCYALTELSYRASFPVQELLGPTPGGAPEEQHGLYLPQALLPGNPVTTADFIRLINDRVPHVANCWFTPHGGAAGPVPGLHDVAVLLDQAAPDPAATVAALRVCYAAHRTLGEDLAAVRLLKPVRVELDVAIELTEASDVNDVLATLLFILSLFLAPEPKRTSLAERLAAGEDTASIFRGPPMLTGFIADDQIAPPLAPVQVDDVLRVIAMTEGVLAVRSIAVRLEGYSRVFGSGDTLPLPPGAVFRLDCTPRGGHFGIIAWRSTALPPVSPLRVERLLAAAWRAQRQRFSMPQDYAEHYTWPAGQGLTLSSYVSVQEQFPAVYGIGAGGLPFDASPQRQALARQLQGYLAPFDQLMADYLSQLAFLPQLFSSAAGGEATYASQSLAPIVPDAASLLAPDYAAGLARLIRAHDPVQVRQTALLDLLLALYASPLAAPPPSGAVDMPHLQEVLLAAKQHLLREVVPATRDRGRGFDVLHPSHGKGRAGLETLARLQLELLSAASGTIGSGGAQRKPFGRRLHRRHWPAMESALGIAEAIAALTGGTVEQDSPFEDSAPPLSLLAALARVDSYRLREPANGPVELVCRDATGVWWVVGTYDGAALAVEAAALFIRHASAHHPTRALYIVEWVLLRFADLPDASAGGLLRVTAVLPAPPQGRDEDHWRRQATTILRENVPAHLALDCLFLHRPALEHFATLYEGWVAALRHGQATENLAEACQQLKIFLQQHLPQPHLPQPHRPAPLPPKEEAVVVDVIAEAEAEAKALVAEAEDTAASLVTEIETVERAVSAVLTGEIKMIEAEIQQGLRAGPPPIEARVKKMEQAVTVAASLLSRLLAWRSRHRFSTPAPILSAVSAPSPQVSAPEEQQPASSVTVPPFPVQAGGAAVGSAVLAQAVAAANAVQHAPNGALGLDCDTVLTSSTAQKFIQEGCSFVVRYISRTTPGSPGDLTLAEAQAITAAGLGLMAVQHVAPAGWAPTAALGQAQGQAAAANAQAAGLPSGINLWLDLESVAPGSSTADITAFCNDWCTEVANEGYLPGLYVGADCGLSGAELYEMLRFAHYWQSGSSEPDVATRGYCMVQTIDASLLLGGVAYDKNVVQTDQLGNTPVWAVRVGRGE